MRLQTLLLLPTVILASQVPLKNEPSTNSSTVPRKLYNELEELARLVDITYCIGIPGTGVQKPFECASRCKDFDHFELVTTWNTGPWLSDSCGYIALSHAPNKKRIIVAFRGTYSVASTIADLTTIPQQYEPYPGGTDHDSDPDIPRCLNCTVHMGFRSAWENTRDVALPDIQLLSVDYPDYELILVGHSLGGAVAALAGLELLARGFDPIVTTFGEPRLGNQAFADYLDHRFGIQHSNSTFHSKDAIKFRRVTHKNDPVPLLPFDEWGYMPHGGEIFLSSSQLPPEPDHVNFCIGAIDPSCSYGALTSAFKASWGISTRFKIWELFFAHREYFWRLGLCVPEQTWLWPVTSRATILPP